MANGNDKAFDAMNAVNAGDDIDLTLDISAFLNTPPQNLKNILPDYTITSTDCQWDERDHESGDYSLNIS